jgi:microcystin-dependent protein
MSNYTPDLWVIVEMVTEKNTIYKVLGSWYGGYLGSDSWRLSSGVTKVIEHDNHYEVHNHSGSIYTCHKGVEGISTYTTSIYEHYKINIESKKSGKMTIVNIKEIPNE